MSKVVLVGDIHVSDSPPVNTTETYTDDIISMLEWVNAYAFKQKADAIVWAGDVFDKKQANRNSHRLVQRMIELVRSSKVPIWCVTGNHDIANDRLDSLESQPLGVLYKSGLNELVGWHPELPVYGVPWQQHWEDPAEWSKAFDLWSSAHGEGEGDDYDVIREPALVVTHASIFPPGQEPIYEYVNLNDLAAAMDNHGSLFYGHIHDHHGVFEQGGVTFCNPGAISRGSLTESHLTREVKIAVWEAGVFTEVAVGNQKSSEDVFRITEGLEKKAAQLDLDAFLTDVGSSSLDISSTSSIVDHINSMEKVEPRIRRRAVQIVEQVG